jgi:predicted ATP-grasp superfamily ATP-dependent carboligase
MRILAYEHVSGGGFAGREVPSSLAREGAAMRDALVADLARMRRHQIVTTADVRFPLRAGRGVEVIAAPCAAGKSFLGPLIESVDAVWLVAPETGRCLERLAATVEKKGKQLLGPGAAAIRRASDKARLPALLARHDIAHPTTCVLGPVADWRSEAASAARFLGFPIVVKPARGAGCEGVSLARNAEELGLALQSARCAAGRGPLVMQRYVKGAAASVSLLADGRRAVPLTVNGQTVRRASRFSYRGGTTPLDHALAGRALDIARRTCEALHGLRGYVGVDLVLTRSEPVVIEVNPRLTTAYLGVRAAIRGNIAEMAMAACDGVLPDVPTLTRSVRFTAAGEIGG